MTVHTIPEILQPFACGGASACIASACVHPIDLSKVRLQLFATINPGKPKPSFATILSNMIREEGFFSIYNGLSASLARQLSYGTARIGLHRTISDWLMERNNGEPLTFLTKTLSGMASGSVAVFVGTPLDVTLVRMQADSMRPKEKRRNYKGVGDALYRVVKEEGFINLYSGLTPNILRGMSINVGMLACYDQAKEIIGKYVFKEDPHSIPSLNTQLTASLVAGLTTAIFSLPFDLLKSRLQFGGKYRGIFHAATEILTKEGIFAFWTGLGAYYTRTAPHAMIILLTAEPITRYYRKLFVNSDNH